MKILKKIGRVVETIAIGLFVLAAAALIFFSVPYSGWRALTVQTGSMEPLIHKGAVVLVRRADPNRLRVGDIITYKSIGKPITITHRIVLISTLPNGLRRFFTKGDANPATDTLPVSDSQIAGSVQHTIPPVLGKAVSFVRTVPGLIIFVYVPALIMAIYEIVLLVRNMSKIKLDEYRKLVESSQRAARQSGATAVSAASAPQAKQSSNPRPRSIDIVKIMVVVLIMAAVFTGGLTYALSPLKAELTDISFSSSPSTTTGCKKVVIESLSFANNDDEAAKANLTVCAPSCPIANSSRWVLSGEEDQEVWSGGSLNIHCTTNPPSVALPQFGFWDKFTLRDDKKAVIDIFRLQDNDDGHDSDGDNDND